MADVFIYDALRTPRAKANAKGGLAQFAPHDLVKFQIDALKARVGDDVTKAEGLTLGCVTQTGAQGANIALVSKLRAGLNENVFAHSINNYCASGLSAIGIASAKVASGQMDFALAGGVEMMSRVPFNSDNADYYSDKSFAPQTRYIPVVLAADRLVNSEGLTREELDRAAFISQTKAAAAQRNPQLLKSLIPTGNLFTEECVRPNTSMESLAALPCAFASLQSEYADALQGKVFAPSLTLGHAPPLCDGAGIALIGRHGADTKPRAKILAFAESGGNSQESLTAGFLAMEKVLGIAKMKLNDIDCIEFMESFAVTIAKFLRDFPIDHDKVNISGGHLAKGHPMGASGAILTSTLLDCLEYKNGNIGMVVISGASGVGTAMIVERLN